MKRHKQPEPEFGLDLPFNLAGESGEDGARVTREREEAVKVKLAQIVFEKTNQRKMEL